MKPFLYAIDDDVSARLIYERIFADDYLVRTFETPQEFCAYFSSEPPAIVITDLMMPDMDGYRVLDWIRERDPHMPVIIATAMSGGEHALCASTNEAGYWYKLDDHNALKELVRCLTTSNTW